MVYTQVYTVINAIMTHIHTHTEKIDTTMKHIVEKGWNQMIFKQVSISNHRKYIQRTNGKKSLMKTCGKMESLTRCLSMRKYYIMYFRQVNIY